MAVYKMRKADFDPGFEMEPSMRDYVMDFRPDGEVYRSFVNCSVQPGLYMSQRWGNGQTWERQIAVCTEDGKGAWITVQETDYPQFLRTLAPMWGSYERMQQYLLMLNL